MNTNHFPTCLLEVIAAQGISQRKLAETCGLSASAISYLVNGGRPDASTLGLLVTHSTANLQTRQRLIIAHLTDEIIRAGGQPAEFLLAPAGHQLALARLETLISRHPSLSTLLDNCDRVPELLATLLDLADLCECYERRQLPQVADGPGPQVPAPKPVTYLQSKKSKARSLQQ